MILIVYASFVRNSKLMEFRIRKTSSIKSGAFVSKERFNFENVLIWKILSKLIDIL